MNGIKDIILIIEMKCELPTQGMYQHISLVIYRRRWRPRSCGNETPGQGSKNHRMENASEDIYIYIQFVIVLVIF